MRNRAKLMRSQSGQILIYTTIIVMLAALILVPLMQFAFTSHRSAQIREERTLELYASDAGIEDALYQIKTEKKGTDLANLGFGNSSSYNPGTPGMNDRTMDVTVQKVWLPEGLPANAAIPNKPTNPPKDWRTIPAPVNNDTTPSLDTDKSDKLVVVGMLQTVQATAGADDFDHGWPDGVSQINGVNQGSWTGNWTTTGSASLASGGVSGYCLNFTGGDGTAMRQTTLPRYLQPELQFWVKGSSFGSSDTVACEVSTVTNPTVESDWTTVMTWGIGNVTGDDTYSINLYDQYGIGNYSVATPLWVRFDANLSTLTSHDDFENGFPSGYPGEWTGSWTQSGTGAASIVSTGSPYSGSNHLQITQFRRVYRKVLNFSSLDNPYLYLWIKGSGFSTSDIAYVDVSTKPSPNPSTGSDWATVKILRTSTTPTLGSYTLYSIDLSTYEGALNFWISLRGAMGSTSTFASEGFENGLPSGDTGIYWSGSWTTSTSGNGAVNISTSYVHGGSRALQLSRSGSASGVASATRIVNISGQSNPQIQFYARSRNTESGDTLTLQLSANGSTWTSIPLSVSSSYQLFTYNVFSYLPQGTTQVYIRFNANMVYASETSSNNDYFYIDDISVVGNPYYYVDNVSISGTSPSFSVDNLWIGYQVNSVDIEIAYTNKDFDTTVGSSGVNDPANIDRIGVWMPPGCEYIGVVVGNQTPYSLSQYLPQPPDILPATYAGGTILEWDFSPIAPNLGNSTTTAVPIIWDLTFSYSTPPTQVVEGMFIWIKAHGAGNRTYLSWDKGYEIYKAVSQAHSEIYGTNTQVAAYVSQGEVSKENAASYGDYVAVGNPLLIDVNDDSLLAVEYPVDPSSPGTWITEDGIFYDGRDEIGSMSIPADAKILAGWLYWSAYVRDSEWSAPDRNVSFMYPERYGSESFTGNKTSLTYQVSSYNRPTDKEPMDLLAHEPVLTLSNMRYLGENLGSAGFHNGNDTFFTLHKPIYPSPAPIIRVTGQPNPLGSGNYTINYNTGNVTIINDDLVGTVSIDYSVYDTKTLVRNTDYRIDYDVVSSVDTRYKGFTILNTDITGGKLQGTVTIDYYYAKHWQAVQHAAQDRYGTPLDPVSAHSRVGASGSYVGWAYACFNDVTDFLTGNGTYPDVTGKGQYAVSGVTATPGVNSYDYRDWCYSGWSLIVLYESPSETAHQFYLYDPIHNPYDPVLHPDGVPFMMTQVSAPSYHDVEFTLTDFYPPEGTVDGRTTCFVGEGDDDINEDYLGFKGASQTSYTNLSGTNNPVNDVMNSISTGGERGIDVDTYTISNISGWVATDTEANVRLRTQVDVWYLVYQILSFKTNVVPKPDYSFNVASVTYQYELGGK
jgi:hypothetical protein